MQRQQQSPMLRGSLYYLAFYFAMAAYLPFINVYFHDLGLTGWQIGILSAMQPVMALLVASPVTVFADHRGRRVLALVVCLLGTSVFLALVAVPTAFLALVLVMALFAAFYSSLIPLSDALVVNMSVIHRLNYGGMRLWGSLGYALSALLCGVIWQRTGYRPMFLAAAGLLIVNAGLASTLDEGGGHETQHTGSWRVILQDRLLVAVLVTNLLVVAAVGVDSTFAGIFMTDLGGTGAQVGALSSVSALFELPAMRYSVVLAERIGGPASLMTAYGLLGVAYVGFTLAHTPAVLLALYVLRGLGYGLYYVGTVRFLNERTPPQWSATIQGIVATTAYGGGQLIARPAAGHVYDLAGGRGVYVCCAVLVAVAVLAMGSVAVARRTRA